jgi:D-apionolactonase
MGKDLQEPAIVHGYRRLKKGKLECLYSHGEIRQLCFAGTQVLNAVYSAVRDHNWATIPFSVRDETIRDSNDSCLIQLIQDFREGNIRYQAHVTISFSERELTYTFRGTSMNSFKKNRIGICILHPVRECSGKKVEITHPDGSITSAEFPEHISPRQPFRDISEMRWSPLPEMHARLEFQGEIFESEDQRNWSDASYKTYAPPLALPYPAGIESGDQIHQSLTLGLDVHSRWIRTSETGRKLFYIMPGAHASLPKIGTSRTTEDQPLTPAETAKLHKLGLSHIRTDLHLGSPGWKQVYAEEYQQYEKLGKAIQLALYFTRHIEDQLRSFMDLYSMHPLPLSDVLLFDGRLLSSPELLNKTVPRLRKYLPDIPLGGGTDANFAELNRNPPERDLLDFITYSICPQVHATDAMTMVENVLAQGDTVESARALSSRPVHIGAVSLRQRFNAVATEKVHRSHPQTDPRQHSQLAAGWTLSSIRELALGGAESVTYYETAGPRGILDRDREAGTDSPLFMLFEQILSDPGFRVVPTRSSHPLEFDGLLLEGETGRKLLMTNYAGAKKEIEIQGLYGTKGIFEIGPGINAFTIQDEILS